MRTVVVVRYVAATMVPPTICPVVIRVPLEMARGTGPRPSTFSVADVLSVPARPKVTVSPFFRAVNT